MEDPIFLMYDSRSGSTFLSNSLASCSNSIVPHESNFIINILKQTKKFNFYINNKEDLNKIIDDIYKEKKFNDWKITKYQIISQFSSSNYPIHAKNLILSILNIYKNKNKDHFIVIKKGSYIFYYNDIQKVFPNSKFIFLIRDGRAVCNSKLKYEPFKSEYNAITAAKRWNFIISKMRKEANDNNNILIIKYEFFLTAKEKELSKIINFLNIDYSQKGYLDMAERYTKVHKNINKGPLGERTDAWKHELKYINILLFEMVSYKMLLKENYPLKNNILFLKILKKLFKVFEYFRY